MNNLFEKLPFKGMAEKIPEGTRAKFPFLNTLIPLANYIIAGLAALVIAIGVANSVAGGGGGKELIGTWEAPGLTYTITKNDITLESFGIKMTVANKMKIKGDAIVVEEGGMKYEMKYQVDGDTLTFLSGPLKSKLTRVKEK